MLNVKFRRIAAAVLAACLTLPALAFAEESVKAAEPAMSAPRPPSAVPPGAPTRPGQPGQLPETAISREEALAIVQKWFTLPDGPGRLDVNLNVQTERPVWEFVYTIEHESGSSSSHIGQVDAETGRILNFSQPQGGFYMPIRTGPLKQNHTQMEAWFKAWELVQALYPEASSRVKTAPAGIDAIYGFPGGNANAWQFKWVEYVGGIPVPNRFIQVAVEKESLGYLSLYASLPDDLTFGSPAAKLTPDEALAEFRALARPVLTYQAIQSKEPYGSRPIGMALVYRMEHLNTWLDAGTGKPITQGYGYLVPMADPLHAQPVPAGDPEGAVVRPVSLPVRPEDTPALLAPLLRLMPEGTQAVPDPYGSYYDPYSGTPPLSVRLETPGSQGGSITVDAATGLIRNAYRWINNEGSAPRAFTAAEKAEALAAATQLVQVLYADLLPELRVSPEPFTQA